MEDLDAELAALEAELEGELAAEVVAEPKVKKKPAAQEPEVVVEPTAVAEPEPEPEVETTPEPEVEAIPEPEVVADLPEAQVQAQAQAPASQRPASAIKTFITPQELKRDLAYNPNTLSNAFQEQASLFAHYSVQKSKASHQEARYKQELEIWDARIDKEIRDEAADSGKKITEAAIAKQILLDERYIKARKRYNEAKLIAELCKDAGEAFRQRRDMLIQSGADAREELKGELRMQGNSRADNAKAAALNAMQS